MRHSLMRNRVQTFILKNSHFVMVFIFLLLNLQFAVLEKTVVPRFWISAPLDDYIPFVPVFVIPYLAWFGIIAVALVILYFHDAGDFVRTFSLLCAGMAAAVFIYGIFPHGQLLRPRQLDDDVFSRLIAGVVYAHDTNTNCFPSIHVLNQLAIHIGLCKSRLMRDRRGWKTASLAATVLVCMSTVLIKQHSILDVIAALLLEIPLYLLVYRVDWANGRLWKRIKRQFPSVNG